MTRLPYLGLVAGCVFMTCSETNSPVRAEDLSLELRYQQETSPDSGRYHQLTREERWNPSETAIVVCDVWDMHHCLNAVRRVAEFAPRLDKVLAAARGRGVTIIHSPSDCMDAYADHPARRRAVETPPAAAPPAEIADWCLRIPAEERAVYPLDQSDGGEDDDPTEHAEWVEELRARGRNPGMPWKRQTELITIDAQHDYISDRGDEVWNVLENRGIKNVILTGVHTNMCVLGRPFGLRQMVRNGKRVVLMRDMTDTMYNPARWPYVSHFTGTDLVVSHIERFVCPTITSSQLLGGPPFRFTADLRPHLVMVIAENEYETARTLPEFARRRLGRDFRVGYVFADDSDRNQLPGLDVLDQADLVLISVRRRVLPTEQLAYLRRLVAAGKPVVGLRTASHAFSLRDESPPSGLAAWPEFDREVFGGHYTNHYANGLVAEISFAPEVEHPILRGIARSPFAQSGSLYRTSPLADETQVLAVGRIPGRPAEPVAWTFTRADGGRSFYTSLGHPDEFHNPVFLRLLSNGLRWAAGMDVEDDSQADAQLTSESPPWTLVQVPNAADVAAESGDSGRVAWYRCVVRLRTDWISDAGTTLRVRGDKHAVSAWLNGHMLSRVVAAGATEDVDFAVGGDQMLPDDANLLVIRVEGSEGLTPAPRVMSGTNKYELAGRWQTRLGDDSSWSNIPLPARFGTPTDIVFQP